MASEEMLVLLNPKSTSAEPTIPATKRGLTPQDVLFALAGPQERLGALLLMLRVADHWDVFHEAYHLLHGMVWERARKEGWRAPSGLDRIIRGMAQYAICEHTIPQRCGSCKGRGWKFPKVKGKEQTTECRRCGGVGMVASSDASRAAAVDVTYDNWRRRWRSRYHAILAELAQRDAEAVRLFRRRTR